MNKVKQFVFNRYCNEKMNYHKTLYRFYRSSFFRFRRSNYCIDDIIIFYNFIGKRRQYETGICKCNSSGAEF